MIVDNSLVEQITKMVLLELTNQRERQDYVPLSEDDLRRWQQISGLIHNNNVESDRSEEAIYYKPLTEEEIISWSQITSNFQQSDKNVHSVNTQVKFHRTY